MTMIVLRRGALGQQLHKHSIFKIVLTVCGYAKLSFGDRFCAQKASASELQGSTGLGQLITVIPSLATHNEREIQS